MIATSTIAMSAYNMLALIGRPMTWDELHTAVSQAYGEPMEKGAFLRAAAGLLRRGYVSKLPGNLLALKDKYRRRVRWRDRTGDGWNGWQVEDPRGPQKLEEVIDVHTS